MCVCVVSCIQVGGKGQATVVEGEIGVCVCVCQERQAYGCVFKEVWLCV